jgi:alpha-glucosidase
VTDVSTLPSLTDAPAVTLAGAPVHTADNDPAWWRHAVIYQIYPRSWADGNGDGIGDLPGITARLPYLRDLGVDAVWLSPFYTSPQADAGYDVADYRDIDPLFGSLADADAMIARAHELGIKVIVDLVPNHSSDEHDWFQAALAAGPGSPERARYLFRDGQGENGELPPNNWDSVFGGPAWTRTTNPDGTPGQWYLHLFDPKQPDFDWTHPEVRAEFEDILRFWLNRGVDGFRVDVAHGLIKEDGLPDWAEPQALLGNGDVTEPVEDGKRPPMWDQDGVHEVYEQWRAILTSYNPVGDGHDPQADRIMCAEAWVTPQERAVRYVRGTEMHQAFNFDFLQAPWLAPQLRAVVESSYAANDSVGAPTTWVLSNHDVVRHASRLGLPVGTRRPNGIGIGDPQPDAELGLRRARAASALMLALPGSSYLYQGEELGLPDSTDMPDHHRQDPSWERSGRTERGRDGCRVPMPWVADAPSLGFGPSDETWLPQPASYRALAVDQQDGVEGSTLELYRALLATRRARALGTGSLTWVEGWPEEVVAFAVTPDDAGRERTLVVANLGDSPVRLPEGADVLLASGPLGADDTVPTDTTVWVRW